MSFQTKVCGIDPTGACNGFLWVTFILGVVKVAAWTFSFLCWLWTSIYRCRKDYYAKYGNPEKETYALVTGGSDGIGLEMCE